MTPIELLIKALNGLKSFNLLRGNKRAAEVKGVKRTETGFRFTISTVDPDPEQRGRMIFKDTYYEIPESAIVVLGTKEKKLTMADIQAGK